MEANEMVFAPCHNSEEFPDRLIFFTENKIDRDYMIWYLGKTTKLTFEQIGQLTGCSESVAGTAFRRIVAIGDEKDILEYFQMGFDLFNIMTELKGNPNRYLNYLMNAMLRGGIRTRSRVKNLTIKQMDDFLEKRDMHNTGKIAKEAFREYRYRLKHHKIYYKGREK